MSQNLQSSIDNHLNNDIFNDSEISTKSLYNLHEKQLLNGKNNNDNTLEIVRVLGGIDAILTDYFINMDRLNKNELHQIKEIIQTTNTYQPNPAIKIDNNPSNMEVDGTFYYEFEKNNTFFRAFCGEKHSKKILNVMQNKAIQIMVGLSLIIWQCLLSITYELEDVNILWVLLLYGLSMQCLVWIPYLILWLLATNRSAFKLLMNSFEFWFKTSYAAIWGMLLCFYHYKWCSSHFSELLRMLTLTNSIVTIFMVILITMAISSIDAFPGNKRWKAIIPALVGVLCWYTSIGYQFLFPAENDYKIYVSMTDAILSLHSMMSSTSRILAIFFTKQAILAIIRSERAVLIKYAPFIKWSDDEINLIGDGNDIAMKEVAKDIVCENEPPNEIKQTKVKTFRRSQDNNSFSSFCVGDQESKSLSISSVKP